jgi:cellulose synthase/poly-beta-1,6-N-acetylglucosamine synthase-like glycosyltransferase
MHPFSIISLIILLLITPPLIYWLIMALAAARPIPPTKTSARSPRHRFAITIPAHNEAPVIESTVQRLRELDYPSDLYAVHIVADHCSDDTAEMARRAGAMAHERREGPRSGKGAALSWLFQRVLAEKDEQSGVDAVIVFDADTRVDPQFLRIMDTRLAQGDQVIQGQHVIRNPKQGWFAALTWAMFLIDNRFQNQGRANLGWSAKHMGDSICFRAEILRKMGWGEGLTEDFQLRQRLLLEGIRITYEPDAKGFGEAPQTWAKARAQRARWLRGTADAKQKLGPQLLQAALKTWNGPLLDGAMQAYFPAYSSLSLVALALLVLQVIAGLVWPGSITPGLLVTWLIVAVGLFLYPLFGLMLERAPLKAYLVILSGPVFMVWRTWLAISSRFAKKPITWVRTQHGGPPK